MLSKDFVDMGGSICTLICGASLAHHGLIQSYGELTHLTLRDLDLSPVPAQHLASLASVVSGDLRIENISGCDLVSLLTNIKFCLFDLKICRQNLGKEETRALVQAMNRVVQLGLLEEVVLDIETLTEFTVPEAEGRGLIGMMGMRLLLKGDTAARYREELIRVWTINKSWKVEQDEDGIFHITHPSLLTSKQEEDLCRSLAQQSHLYMENMNS